MNPIMFTIGNFELRWYSVLILCAVICIFMLSEREASRFNIKKDFMFNLMFWGLIFGIIGARLYYCIFEYNAFKDNLLDIFKVWEGGLAIHGGIIFGLITVILYCKKYNVRVLKIFDIITPSLLIAQAIGRWGNFFNSEAHGAVTTVLKLQEKFVPRFVIDGMNIGGIYYEPTFYYESLWNLLGFLIVIVLRRRKYNKIGNVTAFYLMWYGIGRFFIEAMRTDSLMLGGFKVAQIVSIAMFVTGLIMNIMIARKSKFEDLYNEREKDINY
mgnify:CR=1 FL=1